MYQKVNIKNNSNFTKKMTLLWNQICLKEKQINKLYLLAKLLLIITKLIFIFRISPIAGTKKKAFEISSLEPRSHPGSRRPRGLVRGPRQLEVGRSHRGHTRRRSQVGFCIFPDFLNRLSLMVCYFKFSLVSCYVPHMCSICKRLLNWTLN